MSRDIIFDKKILVPVDGGLLNGILNIPEESKGMIILAHGNGGHKMNNGSTNLSHVLNANGFATLLVDLLLKNEDLSFLNKLGLEQLTDRLVVSTEWVMNNSQSKGLELGYYGECTACSETINASARKGSVIKAVVSRGSNADELFSLINKTSAPVLLLAGNDGESKSIDKQSRQSNIKHNGHSKAFTSHDLFEKQRKLTIIAKISLGWFDKYLNNNHENDKKKWF